ncbi:hypothetical protein CPLU01_02713 [Colletotrichum plurivorum]|uniref:Uncharacterized protein n=1 Tax=Colletotrichum plurivorum TaxID=2175906 RepID=A0A8H6KV15_9PEZI|nr:hypothetical protein CPLU01_02713 [Colletotrichum plurivorum]
MPRTYRRYEKGFEGSPRSSVACETVIGFGAWDWGLSVPAPSDGGSNPNGMPVSPVSSGSEPSSLSLGLPVLSSIRGRYPKGRPTEAHLNQLMLALSIPISTTCLMTGVTTCDVYRVLRYQLRAITARAGSRLAMSDDSRADPSPGLGLDVPHRSGSDAGHLELNLLFPRSPPSPTTFLPVKSGLAPHIEFRRDLLARIKQRRGEECRGPDGPQQLPVVCGVMITIKLLQRSRTQEEATGAATTLH